MKKSGSRVIAYMMTLSMILAVFASYGTLTASAEGAADATYVELPEFTFPAMTYETLGEEQFSADAIRDAVSAAAEYTFVDGVLRVKPLFADEEFIFSTADDEPCDIEYADGYYYVDVTEEAFAEGFYSEHRNDDARVSFMGDLAQAIILLYNPEDPENGVKIYPHDGWDGDFDVFYDVAWGEDDWIYVENDYRADGSLKAHNLEVYLNEDQSVIAGVIYKASGEIDAVYVNVSGGDYYGYVPGVGWDMPLPEEYAYLDEQYIRDLLPPMFLCEHDWQRASCDLPEQCTVCREQREKAKGHSYEEEDGLLVCTECGYRRMKPVNLPSFSLESMKPKAQLSELGLPLDELRAALLRDLPFSYEDGVLNMAVPESAYVYVYENNYSYDMYDHEYVGENQLLVYVPEDEIDGVVIDLYVDEDTYTYYVEYDRYGKPTGDYYLELYTSDMEKIGYVEELADFNTVNVVYCDDPYNIKYQYKDVYKDGAFCEREITYCYQDEYDMELEIRYDAKGEIVYIEAEVGGEDVYYNFTHGCWTRGRNYYSPADTPKMAVGKTVEELLAVCPSGLDFLSAGAQDGNGGEPCGVLGIILTAGGALLLACGALVGGYLFGKKKKVR